MTSKTFKKATVAAILSSSLILAVPVMGAEKEGARVSDAASTSFFDVSWLLERFESLVDAIRIGSSDQNQNRQISREKVTIQNRACSDVLAEGCKD